MLFRKGGIGLKKRFFTNVVVVFLILSFFEFFLLKYINIDSEKIIENMIQLFLLNVTILAFYTWHEDNKLSNIELAFEFDKRWDEIINTIEKEYNDVKEKIAKDKAEIEDNDYLVQLKLLKNSQQKLRFLLDKIKYYEGNFFEKKIKSYIDFGSAITNISESADLIFEINKSTFEILNSRKELLNLYKDNLTEIKRYLDESDYRRNSSITKTCEDIDITITNINEYIQESNSIRNKSNEKDNIIIYNTLIGKAVGNSRYFKPTDDSILIFTSRNWNEDNDNIYETWYSLPKRCLREKKDYYFIVREPNERSEYPFLRLNNNKLVELVKQKNSEEESTLESDENYIHFYFKWNKVLKNTSVKDTRNDITLEKGTYELGKAQLRDGQLFV